ncbi:MAG: L,D-transpeptidase [bacterium]|nr:L,D-transpeptidase [bacterium]
MVYYKGVALFLLCMLCGMTAACSRGKDPVQDIRMVLGVSKARYLVYVSKKDFSLSVYDRKLKKTAEYTIGYGANPDRKAKIHAGDARTPEGVYYINEILSMDAHKDSAVYKKLRNMNRVYFSSREGHHKYGKPGVDLGDNVYGPRYFGLNYPNDSDKERYAKEKKGKTPGIGSGIAIHGNADEQSIGTLCSNGCVRMYNNDIIGLERYIEIGTPVILSP